MTYYNDLIALKHRLAYWNHFDGEERFLLYNPLNDTLIIGAKRLGAIEEDEMEDYPYVFNSLTFFDTTKEEKWQGMGNELVAYENYFVDVGGSQSVYYARSYPGIIDEIEKVEVHKHKKAVDDYDKWAQLYDSIHDVIVDSEASKVVISREIKLICESPVNISSVIDNLMVNNPTSFIYAYNKDGKTFLGATPELLVEKKGSAILSYAMAGTLEHDEEDVECQKRKLLSDQKNHHEHQIVIDSIVKTFERYSQEIIKGKTDVKILKNIMHLFTPVQTEDTKGSILQWVERLHPTPALGGEPRDKALSLIKAYETHERGLYASPIGVIESNGDGLFVVGIRGALIIENEVYVYVGCGIVEESDCYSEYVESMNKAKTLMESL